MDGADRDVPARFLSEADLGHCVPVHVVWEITLACDLKCLHCGSRAGRRRPAELTTAECLSVVDSLAALGTREVSLIGGEAYLRRDWTTIVRAIRAHGITVNLPARTINAGAWNAESPMTWSFAGRRSGAQA